MTKAHGTSIDVQSGSFNGTERSGQLKNPATVFFVFPCGKCTKHLSAKRLVNLVEIEVLESEFVARQEPGCGIRGGHQKSLGIGPDVTDRGRLGIRQIRLQVYATLRGPLFPTPILSRPHHRLEASNSRQ